MPGPQHIYEPMLATPADKIPLGDEWRHEKKFDGMRMFEYVRPGRDSAVLLSRRHTPYTHDYMGIARETVAAFAGHTVVADSELVHIVLAADNERRDSRLAMQRRIGIAQAYIFDLVMLDGEDLTKLPFDERRHRLTEVFKPTEHVRLSEVFSGDTGQILFDAIKERGGEGIVSKRGTSRYAEGRRSRSWRKIKVPKELILP